jgi:hypothetical protein
MYRAFANKISGQKTGIPLLRLSCFGGERFSPQLPANNGFGISFLEVALVILRNLEKLK